MKILLIENEPDTATVLGEILSRESWKIINRTRGVDGVEAARLVAPDLIVLDCVLPDIDGIEVCRRLKRDPLTSETPIIMISAEGRESDVALGLGMGVDDYLCKPYRPLELVARAKAVIRRKLAGRQASDADRLVRGGLVIDSVRHDVTLDGRPVHLTATEFRVLHLLASQPGRAFTRGQMLNHVVAVGDNVVPRNIDVHVRSIRHKLGVHAHMIETIQGVGYRFADPYEPAAAREKSGPMEG
ncbi:MAG: response regulator transcription factor [Candidatus Riflebacteria bacterium]|nr:response regulator transcription factor [Candidatus Riflebacteria bacterium]